MGRAGSFLACLLVFAGCGGDGDGKGGAGRVVDRSRPIGVYSEAMRAVHERDFDALWQLLTPAGRIDVQRNLQDWQARLRDPGQWADMEERIRQKGALVPVDLLEQARMGGLRETWTFLLTVDPRPRLPWTEGLYVSEDNRAFRALYYGSDRTVREMLMVWTPEGWAIQKIQL
jgi:hypothetical protein